MVVSPHTSLTDNLKHTLASFLHSGASCWHGPHHEAKKSTIHSSSGDLLPTLEKKDCSVSFTTVTIQYSLNDLVMYVFLSTTHPLLLARQTPDSVFTHKLQ